MMNFTVHFRDEHTCIEMIERTAAVVDAMRALLVGAINSDVDLRANESGIYDMFEPWILQLADGAAFLGACNMRRHDAAAFERTAEEKPAAEAGSERVRTIRRDLISEALTKGIDPGEIASAMNMHRSSIEKVKRRLAGEAYSAPDDSAAANG